MPTYGYECLSCDNEFETFQSIKDDALTLCDSCGGALRKRVYPVGIAFKGSGFYVNDYAPKSGGSSNGAAPDAPKAEAGSGDKAETAKAEPAKADMTKSESKPDAKADAKAPVATSA